MMITGTPVLAEVSGNSASISEQEVDDRPTVFLGKGGLRSPGHGRTTWAGVRSNNVLIDWFRQSRDQRV